MVSLKRIGCHTSKPYTISYSTSGNEVIQYNPPEDIASLFDLGDLSSSTPLDEDDVINNSSTLNTPFVRTDDEGPQLLAPGTTMTTSTEEVDWDRAS